MTINPTETSFRFQWDPSTDDHGILGYRVSLDGLIVAEVDAATLDYEVTGLQPGSTVTMRVQAMDIDGLFSQWSLPFVVTTLTPPDAEPGWEPVYFLTQGDEDTENVVEADLCVLDSGLVVVASLSTYSYALRLQAIDPATGELGPKAYFNNDWSGADTIPVDPKQDAIDDLSFVIAMGDHRFAMIGNASASYEADGDYNLSGGYGHVASWFDVDPDDLTITRVGFSVAPEVDYYSDEVTASRWGNKLVVLPEAIGAVDTIAIVDATTFAVTLITGRDNTSTPDGRNGPIVVTGNYGFYLLQSLGAVTIDLTDGSTADEISTDFGAYGGWAAHGCTLSDGRVAMITPGPDPDAVRDPLMLSIFTIGGAGQITEDDTFEIVPDGNADNVGWTGGWYSNVRSVSAMPDDTLLIAWSERAVSNMFKWAKVNPEDGTIIEQGDVPTVWVQPSYNYTHQMVAIGQDEWAALWIGAPDNDSDWGLYTALKTNNAYGTGDGWHDIDLSEAAFYNDGTDDYGQLVGGQIVGGVPSSIVFEIPSLKRGEDYSKYDYIEVEVDFDSDTEAGDNYAELDLATTDWDGDTFFAGWSQGDTGVTRVRLRTGPTVEDWDDAPLMANSFFWFGQGAIITAMRWRIVQSVPTPLTLQSSTTIGYQGPRWPTAWDGAHQHLMESVTNNARYYAIPTADLTNPDWVGGFGYTETSSSNAEFANYSGFVRDGLTPIPLYMDSETDKYQFGVIRPLDTGILLISHLAYPSQTFTDDGFIRGWAVFPGSDQVFAYGGGPSSGSPGVNAYRSDIDVDGVLGAWVDLGAVTYDSPGDFPGGGTNYLGGVHGMQALSGRLAFQRNTRGMIDRLNPTAIIDTWSLIPTTSGDDNLYDTFQMDALSKPNHLLVVRGTGSSAKTKIVDVLVDDDGLDMSIANQWAIPGGASTVVVGWTAEGKAVAYVDDSGAYTAYYDLFGTPQEFTPAPESISGSTFIVPTRPTPDDDTYDSWLVGNVNLGFNYALVLEQIPLP